MRNRTVRRLCALVVFLSLPPASAAVGQTQQRTQRLLRMTNDVLSFELVPSFKGQYKGAMFETNRWGMRDLDYELKPPTGTYRIALVGSSFTMGAGVPLEKTHEWLIEDRLNREGPSLPGRRYEILNFSVGNYGVLQEVAVLTRKVFPFAPNAVLLAIHDVEQARMLNHVVNLVRNNVAIEFPYVRQKLQAAGVQNGMEIPELRRRIAPIAPDLVRWSYQRIAEICRENNVPLVGIVYPEPPREGAEE